MPAKANDILFVELLGEIGDVLIALPAIQSLARSHPDARLTVLTFAPGGELLQHDPLIHQIIVANPDEARQAVDAVLADHQFDVIVSDTNYDGIDQAIQNSGAPRTVTNLWQFPPPHKLVGERFLDVLLREDLIEPSAIGRPRLHLTPDEQDRARAALGDIQHPVTFLIPDAGMAIKRWPSESFVTLGRALRQRYDATVIVPVGSDADLAEGIAGEIGGTACIWPRGSLRELAAAMDGADLAVGADTGVSRIAAALKVPTITLLGPTWYGRYGQPAPHLNLQGFAECSERVIKDFTIQPCWYSGVCPIASWGSCLESISPHDVLSAAASFLEDQVPGRRRRSRDTRRVNEWGMEIQTGHYVG